MSEKTMSLGDSTDFITGLGEKSPNPKPYDNIHIETKTENNMNQETKTDWINSRFIAITLPMLMFMGMCVMIMYFALTPANDEIQLIRTSVQDANGRIDNVYGAINQNGKNIAINYGAIVNNATELKFIKKDIAVLKTDIAVLKTDVAVLKTGIKNMKTDVASIKSDVANLTSLVTQVLEKLDK